MKKGKVGKSSKEAILEQYNRIGKRINDKMFISDIEFLTLAEKDNCIRIMPPLNDGEFFGKEVYIHYRIGLDEAMYLCNQKTLDEHCYICEYQKGLIKNNADEEEVKQYYPTRRMFYNTVDMSNKGDGVKLFACPGTLSDEIIRQSVDPDTMEVLDITDPEEGYNLFITRTGKGMTTRYTGVRIARKESPLEDDKWLDQLYDFEKIIIPAIKKDVLSSLGEFDDDAKTDVEDEDVKEDKEDEEKTDTRANKRQKADEEESDDNVRQSIQRRLRR